MTNGSIAFPARVGTGQVAGSEELGGGAGVEICHEGEVELGPHGLEQDALFGAQVTALRRIGVEVEQARLEHGVGEIQRAAVDGAASHPRVAGAWLRPRPVRRLPPVLVVVVVLPRVAPLRGEQLVLALEQHLAGQRQRRMQLIRIHMAFWIGEHRPGVLPVDARVGIISVDVLCRIAGVDGKGWHWRIVRWVATGECNERTVPV